MSAYQNLVHQNKNRGCLMPVNVGSVWYLLMDLCKLV
jgi:hypothetical protein